MLISAFPWHTGQCHCNWNIGTTGRPLQKYHGQVLKIKGSPSSGTTSYRSHPSGMGNLSSHQSLPHSILGTIHSTKAGGTMYWLRLLQEEKKKIGRKKPGLPKKNTLQNNPTRACICKSDCNLEMCFVALGSSGVFSFKRCPTCNLEVTSALQARAFLSFFWLFLLSWPVVSFLSVQPMQLHFQPPSFDKQHDK